MKWSWESGERNDVTSLGGRTDLEELYRKLCRKIALPGFRTEASIRTIRTV